VLGPLPGCSTFLPADEPVFARVAGDPASPLVLYVHGSGPRNSSMFWNNLVEAVYALHPKLYHVAIYRHTRLKTPFLVNPISQL
jgi:hypothetical protein